MEQLHKTYTQGYGQIFAHNKVNMNNNQSKEHKNTWFNPRFDHTTKVSYFPADELTKGQAFSNPNPPFGDHKGQGKNTF